MKAKEYFKEFLTTNQQKSTDWRFISALRKMVLEVNDIAKMRNAEKDEALRSIFREQNMKAKSFIKKVNNTRLNYREDSFMILIKSESPELYELIK